MTIRVPFCLWFLAMIIISLCTVTSVAQKGNNVSWKEVKKFRKGTITVYWDESRPFIFQDASGRMRGIEPEILEGFKEYLNQYHHIDLSIEWIDAQSFGDTYQQIANGVQPGVFGASAFSITPERAKEVDFSKPYMADICVLITSKDIPIVSTLDEFNSTFNNLTAVTIRKTTYEQDLLDLRNKGDLKFSFSYIPSSLNILREIEKMEKAFGFIDLPVYLMIFNDDPSLTVKRQNLFSTHREGYAFIFPKNTDWGEPLNEYFSHKSFQPNLEKIMSKYFNLELYHFIEQLSAKSNDEVELLTREKEIQYNDLIEKSLQIAQATRSKRLLIALIVIVASFMTVIGILYRKQNQQKKKIETQQKSIEQKSAQLEKRNNQLIGINEEKNNLIRILAHDLRTPISHIQGLTQVLLANEGGLNDDQIMLSQKILDASVRLNKMIVSILDTDALENDRVKLFISDIQISPLVQQVVKSFEKQASAKNITLRFQTDDENHFVKGESLFLMQIVENLLSNALKFSEPNKKVEVDVEAVGQHIWISVKDQGPGLTEEDISMLFKKFQRLSAKPTGDESSTGLGLSIVKKYIELMNGRVWCKSEPGKGATFTVELPKA